MATVTKYKINGAPTEPFREAYNVLIKADFGTESQPSISLESVEFTDSAGAFNSQKIRQLWAANPVEGADFEIEIVGKDSNGVPITYPFPFTLDYTRMNFLSDVDTEIGVILQKSLDEFDIRIDGITQTLLKQEGLIGIGDYQPIPYVIENRKTRLERIQILYQTFIVIKSIIDEIHKIINIASDLPTIGAVAAAANLTATLAGIVTLTIQLANLFQEIQENFFPPVRYHSGIRPKFLIEKCVIDYMGYDGVEWGTALADITDEAWVGSKNNEQGFPQFTLLGGPNDILFALSGLFKPNDAGYFMNDFIDIVMKKYRMRRAIINNVLHLRPENDPFWVTLSGYVMPSIRVEQTFEENGFYRPNYEDLKASKIISYATDDSDLQTLDDLASEDDPNSTGKIISVTTLRPISVSDQRKVMIKGADLVEIPHCLASRKDQIDDLIELFLGSVDEFGALKDQIENIIGTWASVLGASNPAIAEFIETIGNRTGAMKVENHFFSIPKQMLLTTNQQGLPTIPANFTDRIGARALYDNYHIWDSFIPGNRNPNDPTQTAAKYVYEGVRIAPFGIEDFDKILNNAYFTDTDGDLAKFTSVEWDVEGDSAVVNYWKYNNWVTNVIEETT